MYFPECTLRTIVFVLLVFRLINFCSARHVNRKYPWSRTEAVRDNVLVKQPAPGIYLFKVKNENTRRMYEICSKLRIKTPE